MGENWGDGAMHNEIPAKAGIQQHMRDRPVDETALVRLHARKTASRARFTSEQRPILLVGHRSTRAGTVDGFTKQYGVDRLVYFEAFEDIAMAVLRERQIKKWNRDWKIRLIEENNPEWRDLYPEIAGI